jgi:hypothetical protein
VYFVFEHISLIYFYVFQNSLSKLSFLAVTNNNMTFLPIFHLRFLDLLYFRETPLKFPTPSETDDEWKEFIEVYNDSQVQ